MKNSKGISLIALIITIIVIIILAAIVIGGVFNTPNDAKFANFCQQYDELQTQIRLKYYELYQQDALNNINNTTVKNVYELYNQVATGSFANKTADEWVPITFGATTGLTAPSVTGTYWLRLSDGKLVYAGFQKNDTDYYFTPAIYGTATIANASAVATTATQPSSGAFTLSTAALTASSTPAPTATPEP